MTSLSFMLLLFTNGSANQHGDPRQGSSAEDRVPISNLLFGHKQQRLKLRSFRLLVDNGSFDIDEARALEHGFEIRFAEAKPLVGVELARLLEAVTDEIDRR